MGSANLGLTVTFSNIAWDWAGWAWVMVLMPTLAIIPSAQHTVRLNGVTQREVLTNFVSRCFTGLRILTAINGSNADSDEEAADKVPLHRSHQREVRLRLTLLVSMPVASGFGLDPAGGEAPKIVSDQARVRRL